MTIQEKLKSKTFLVENHRICLLHVLCKFVPLVVCFSVRDLTTSVSDVCGGKLQLKKSLICCTDLKLRGFTEVKDMYVKESLAGDEKYFLKNKKAVRIYPL